MKITNEERKLRDAAAQRYAEARAEWQEVCHGMAAKGWADIMSRAVPLVEDSRDWRIQCKVEDGWRMARAIAEQGGVFSALEFNKRAPDALTWYGTLPDWQRKGYVDSVECQEELDDLDDRRAWYCQQEEDTEKRLWVTDTCGDDMP